MLEEKCWKQRASSTKKISIGGSAEKNIKMIEEKSKYKKILQQNYQNKIFLEKFFGKFLPVILIKKKLLLVIQIF